MTFNDKPISFEDFIKRLDFGQLTDLEEDPELTSEQRKQVHDRRIEVYEDALLTQMGR